MRNSKCKGRVTPTQVEARAATRMLAYISDYILSFTRIFSKKTLTIQTNPTICSRGFASQKRVAFALALALSLQLHVVVVKGVAAPLVVPPRAAARPGSGIRRLGADPH